MIYSGGYPSRIVSRPLLYDLLLTLVPTHRLHFSKRVLSAVEEEGKVRIQTSDNSTYEGDILVGADGAYSAVRQRLYDTLKKKGTLPKSDQEDLPFSCTCLVGQTDPLDVGEYPELKNMEEPFFTYLGKDKPYTVSTNLHEYRAHFRPEKTLLIFTSMFPTKPHFPQCEYRLLP